MIDDLSKSFHETIEEDDDDDNVVCPWPPIFNVAPQKPSFDLLPTIWPAKTTTVLVSASFPASNSL